MAELKFIKNLSVKNKITLIIIFIAFTVIISGFIFVIIWVGQRHKDEMVSQLKLEAQLIGDYCIIPLVFEDNKQASNALSRLKFLKSVDEGYLLNESGEILATYPDTLSKEMDSTLLIGKPIIYERKHFLLNEFIQFENKTIGVLVVKANSLQLKQENRELTFILSTVLVAMLLLCFLLASRLQHLITAPILRLAELTSRISETHDYTVKLEEPGTNEIGFLYKQFNNLLAQIQHKQNERDEAEKELKFLAQVIKNINEFVSITDLDDTIIFVNHAWLKKFEYKEEEVLGKKISIIISKNNSPELISEILPATKKGGWTGTLNNITKSGQEFPIMLNTTIIYNNNNEAIALVGVSSDITEQKKAEQKIKELNADLEYKIKIRTAELATANDELKAEIEQKNKLEKKLIEAKEEAMRANRTKSEFLANMSHEIRTPMNAILGYSELLEALAQDQIQKEYLNSIKTSGRSLLSLINDFLDLSKIEAGKIDLELEFVETRRFFIQFEKIFAFKIIEKGLKFKLDITSSTPQYLYIDEPRLRQVLLNIIGNATKFTEKGEIKLVVKSENPHSINYHNKKQENVISLVIGISDTGIGIPKTSQKEIFDSFIQVKNKTNTGGTGLGLAISKKLIQLMGGEISLTSKVGVGTTFLIKIPDIPYLTNYEMLDLSEGLNPSEILFEKSTLLVVDDVDENRNFLRDALKNTPIEVIDTDNGISALELLKKYSIDLIITDIRMPVMDGFQLVERIKKVKKYKRIPIIAYSASVMKEQKDRIFNSDFEGLLMKPLQINQLYNSLIKFLAYKKREEPEKLHTKVQQESIQIFEYDSLMKKLHGEIKEMRDSFQTRQPIQDVKKFGKKLTDIGKYHAAESIISYGNEIFNAADNFNIGKILKLIQDYDQIVEKLKMK